MKWLALYGMALQRPLVFDILAGYGIAALQSSRELAQALSTGSRVTGLRRLCAVLDAHAIAVPDAVSRCIELACVV